MKLVFAGTPEVAVPALDALIASGRHEVAAVVTRPDAPAGRGRRLVASPVAAAGRGGRHRGAEARQAAGRRSSWSGCGEIAPDCCPVVAYGALLPQVALDIPPRGWVNLHFSLLPAWRGAAPVQHAIMAGDEITGASTFLIEEGLDSGPVYGDGHRGDPAHRHQRRPARPGSPSPGAGLLAATMDGIEDGTLKAVPQPADGHHPRARRSPSRTPRSTGPRPRCASTALVRACTPAPGRLDRRSAASGSSSVRSGRSPSGPTSPPARWPSARTACTSAPARRRSSSVGAAAGQEADAGRRLGPRRADRGSGETVGAQRPAQSRPRTPGAPQADCPHQPSPNASARIRPRQPAGRRRPTSAATPGRLHHHHPEYLEQASRARRSRPGRVRRKPGKPYRRPRRTPRASSPSRCCGPWTSATPTPTWCCRRCCARHARRRGFDGRDAALATELVYGTLRRQGTYDAVIAACVDRPLREVDPPVLDVLRLGVHQLLGTRIPTHAAVVRHRRTRPGRARRRARQVRQRRAAQGRRARSRRAGSRGRPALRRRPRGPPRRRPLASALGRLRAVGRRSAAAGPASRTCWRPTTSGPR